MAYTAAQVIALETAIASGTTKVRYGDKEVEYRSLADMRQILSEIKLGVGGLQRIRQLRVTTSGDKGL